MSGREADVYGRAVCVAGETESFAGVGLSHFHLRRVGAWSGTGCKETACRGLWPAASGLCEKLLQVWGASCQMEAWPDWFINKNYTHGGCF